MKDTQLNPLNQSQRRLLQFGVVILLAVFLAGWFYFMNRKPSNEDAKNTTVYIQDNILHAFDDTHSLAQYPNRVAMHYPYLLVIKPGEQATNIYNLPEKRKEKDVQEPLLDYTDSGVLKNSGKSTFFNDRDLGVLCEKGYIKSEQEVLCLTKVNPNTVENKLVSIDTSNNKQTDIYVSKNLITDFSIVGGTVYMGEIDLYNKQNYLIDREGRIEVPSVVSLVYEMNGQPYFASLKNAQKGEEIYYQLMDGKLLRLETIRIILFE